MSETQLHLKEGLVHIQHGQVIALSHGELPVLPGLLGQTDDNQHNH